jgi:MFS family permease
MEVQSGWRAVLTGSQGRLTAGILLIVLTVATESLIVTAIMPVIVRDIGGLSFYGLAFSAFFLAGLASIPTAGWAADRHGPALPFALLITLFLAGSVVAAVAPTMVVLVIGRLLQGYGAGAQLTLAQGTIARVYPAAARVKVLSLMSAAWVAPGLLGPPLGALIASTVGWRWAFAAVVAPALVACVLTYPSLRTLGPTLSPARPGESPAEAGRGGAPAADGRAPIRWPVQVALGAGLVIAGLTAATWWGAVLVLAGVPTVIVALQHTLPPGSLRARPGLPAIVAAGYLLNVAFYSASSFVPLVLTHVRGTSVAAAGLAVSGGAVAWTVGVWVNTQLVDRLPRSRLVAAAALLLGVGVAGFAASLFGAPLALCYGGWLAAGFGMGITFNTFSLNAMALAPRGGEATAMGARNLSANLGTATGTGIGGAAIAVSSAAGVGLRPGLIFVYGLALVGACLTATLSRPASPT